jgi:hypothetical protein
VRQLEHGTWELGFSTRAAVTAVFDYIADFQRHVEWEEELLEVKQLTGRAGEFGAKYLKTYGTRPAGLIQRLFWSPTRIDCAIRMSERPNRLVWRQQLWRDQPSDSYDRQDVELLLTANTHDSEVTFVRRLMVDDAASAGMAMGAYDLMSSAFRNAPPGTKEKLLEEYRRRYPDRPAVSAFDLTRDQVAGDLMENLPIRGPGSRSLERLKKLLDGLPG